MARPMATDFLHSMRFQVFVTNVGGGPPGTLLRPDGRADAGFSACSLPEVSAESVTYKEGNMNYERKQPGAPTVGDATLSRGVTRGDSSFWTWIRTVAEGRGEYRADLDIKHYHRDNVLLRSGGTTNLTQFSAEAQAARTYHLGNCFPTTHKPAGDLEASGSDISIMEMTIAVETIEVEEHAPPSA